MDRTWISIMLSAKVCTDASAEMFAAVWPDTDAQISVNWDSRVPPAVDLWHCSRIFMCSCTHRRSMAFCGFPDTVAGNCSRSRSAVRSSIIDGYRENPGPELCSSEDLRNWSRLDVSGEQQPLHPLQPSHLERQQLEPSFMILVSTCPHHEWKLTPREASERTLMPCI